MRITAVIITIFLIFVTPYFVYLPAILFGIIFFPLYLEAIILGLFIDVIYGRPDAVLLGFPFGILSAILVLFAVPLREYLRFNA